MRRHAFWVLLALVIGCHDGGNAVQDPLVEVRAGATAAERVAGWLLVVRLGDGDRDGDGDEVEVLRSRALHSAPRGVRRVPRHWKGRWEVRSGDERVLDVGRFRIPRRRHVLLGDVGGPAQAVDVTLERPVVWIRLRVTPGARKVVLYDDFGRRRLGEVAL
jgi:hypothetical protein